VYQSQITFLPQKDLLYQIIRCEGLERFFESRPLSEISKQELLARILVGDYLPETQEKVKINKNPDSQLLRSCSASHLDPNA
jgi:hypothetical protein